MKWINNLKTGVKLFGSFGAVILLMIAISLISYNGMNNINNGMTSMYFDRTLPIQQLGLANMEESNLRIYLNGMIVFPENIDKYEQNLNASINNMNTQLDAYRATQLDPEEKTGLASFDKNWPLLQQEIKNITASVKNGDLAGAKTLLGAGSQFITAYTDVETALNELSAINSRIAGEVNAQGDVTFASSRNLLIGVAIFAILLALGLGTVISRSITLPLAIMSGSLANISKGNLNRDVSQEIKDSLTNRDDEFGTAGKNLAGAEIYMQEMAQAANSIAQNDLSLSVSPKSEKDELGNAFSKMIASLQKVIGQVADSANSVASAAAQLAKASEQSGEATNQIAITIQQVAKGTTEQTEGVTRTAGSVEQMSRAIDGVARGAQEQANAVTKASQVASRISTAIEQVTTNAQAVTRDSAEAARYSRDGAKTVKETIIGMEAIRAKVGISATKVTEMGTRSEEIGAIVETIED
ncbi:MAG: MCP four helix bundle domain-containing protein, partial [Chloroflexi bacterium]|nr:MCP four helix bundle domain-containing protein [Chloroflexota bacterium]